jgi:hypothetical protein
MFMQDHTFRAKGKDGRGGSEISSATVEAQRRNGKMHGTIHRLGTTTKEKEEALIAFKQFGIYSRAKSNVKPELNKHEVPKGKL